VRKSLDSALNGLKKMSEETCAAIDRLRKSVDGLSSSNCATIIGVFGGFSGFIVAYGLSFRPGISLVVSGPLLGGFGITVALLLHRGPRRIFVERQLDLNRHNLNETLDRLRKLPKDAPAEVRMTLWQTCVRINSEFDKMTHG